VKLARYIGGGRIAIVEEPEPTCPPGGLLVKTEASGLCSGELMDWYMESKIPHVLGHEVAGIVVESQDGRFPSGCRVFAHHHAPCMSCEMCRQKLYVHCPQWKRTKLTPGGMAEFFAVSSDNLTDTLRVDDLRPVDAALIEPLACVVKSLRASGWTEGISSVVIGLGAMGLMHALLLPGGVSYDVNVSRLGLARKLGLDARSPEQKESADVIFVCPGNKAALDFAIDLVSPGGTIVMFAPMPPGAETPVDMNRLYFRDAKIVNSYSCGPDDTSASAALLREGKIKAEQVVSDFIEITDLPKAYSAMKKGEILKAMVVF
jgi:L-iditol 2-dehydrogenase